MDVLLKAVESNENGEHTFDPAAEAGGEHVDQMEIKQINDRIKEMEAENKKFSELKNQFEKNLTLDPPGPCNMGIPEMSTMQDKQERDQRSVYVGNVDYGSSEEELRKLFGECGCIKSITIKKNIRGEPLGYAYIEFSSKEAVQRALSLDQATFRERSIKVMNKRTNVPGLRSRRMPGRWRFGPGGGSSLDNPRRRFHS